MSSTPLTSPRFSRAQFLGLLVLLATLIAFHNSLEGAFIFDDFEAIHLNPTIRDLSKPGSVLSPPRDTTVAGRPLLNLTFALNYAMGILAPRGYHIVNIGIHAAAALILFQLLRFVLKTPRMPPAIQESADVLAALAAILWAIHPLQTESVTYIVQRAESLCGLAYLLSLYCAVRYFVQPAQRRWCAYCVLASAAGMGCKEVMVTAPLMILLLDRALFCDSFRQAITRRMSLYVGLACSWLVLGILLAGAPRSGTTGFTVTVRSSDYLVTEASVILHYLRLSIWPHPLILDYSWPIQTSWRESVLPLIAMATLLAATAITWFRRPILALPIIAFLFPLAPTSSFYPMYEAAFEHRMYLPLAPLVLAFTLGIHAICLRFTRNDLRKCAAVTSVVCGIAAVALGMRTIARNADYADPVALWQSNLEHGGLENSRAWTNLSSAFLQSGRAAEARDAAVYAIQKSTDNLEAYVNLCAAANGLGFSDESINAGRIAVQLKPASVEAHVNLGLAYISANRLDAARHEFTQALEIQSDCAPALDALAQIETLNRQSAATQPGTSPEAGRRP